MDEIEFEIPVLLPTGNQYSRWHWTKQRKHTRDIAREVSLALHGKLAGHVPFRQCLIFIERHSTVKPSSLDWDNLFAGLKGLLDSLTVRHKHGLGIIQDDSTACIVSVPTLIPVRCEKGHEKTKVKIVRV